MSSTLKIDWATHEAAKFACENWHYSKCLPASKILKIGAWEDGKFIGVILYSRGASPNLGTKFNLQQTECVELTRVALKAHKNAVSKIISISIKFLQKQSPGIKLIVSFADPTQGHHGGVYQAGNWIYSGKTAQTKELFINNRWMHWRNGFHLKTKETKQRITQGKYRYLYPLTHEMRQRILPLARPYPKRAGSIVADAPAIHAGEGGAEPTPALQSL